MFGPNLSTPALSIRQSSGYALGPNFASNLMDWPIDGGERHLTGETVSGRPIWNARVAPGQSWRGPFQQSYAEIVSGQVYDISILARSNIASSFAVYFSGQLINPFASLTSEWAWYSSQLVAGTDSIVELRPTDFVFLAGITIRVAS